MMNQSPQPDRRRWKWPNERLKQLKKLTKLMKLEKPRKPKKPKRLKMPKSRRWSAGGATRCWPVN